MIYYFAGPAKEILQKMREIKRIDLRETINYNLYMHLTYRV